MGRRHLSGAQILSPVTGCWRTISVSSAFRRAGFRRMWSGTASFPMKPARLNAEETEIVRQHPVTGERICAHNLSFFRVQARWLQEDVVWHRQLSDVVQQAAEA